MSSPALKRNPIVAAFSPLLLSLCHSCPCVHANFYSNQRWCCGDMQHIDISEEVFKMVSAACKLGPASRGCQAAAGRPQVVSLQVNHVSAGVLLLPCPERLPETNTLTGLLPHLSACGASLLMTTGV